MISTAIAKDPEIKVCEVYPAGEALFDRLLELIRQARKEIHLQFYIFSEDHTGRQVQEALIEASKRGVGVYMVLDGIGSRGLSADFLNAVKAAGISLHFFSPVRWTFPLRMGRRLHHKLVVIDGEKALTGGFNIADRYRGTDESLPWFDLGVYLEGPVCLQLQKVASSLLGKRILRRRKINYRFRRRVRVLQRIMIRQNDWLSGKLGLRRSYYRAIRSATRRITIVASYFLPSHRMISLLSKAASRGVSVTLMLPGTSDALFYKSALQFLYPALLKKGVRIFEYQPTVLHAKAITVDDRWCSIGSYNLNDLSDLLSLELNVEISDARLCLDFRKFLDQVIISSCREVDPAQYQHPPFYAKLKWKLFHLGIIQSIRLLHWLTEKSRRNVLG